MNGKFEKLIIWQRAMELGENINGLSESQKEIYNLAFRLEDGLCCFKYCRRINCAIFT
jgi:hypothetical protein